MTLLVIDTQKGITDSRLYGFETLRANIKALIARAREEGVEVIYVRHDDGPGTELAAGAPGWEIAREVSPMKGEKIFDKRFNSAFLETGLEEYLREADIKTLVVAGLQTEYCIDATVKSAFERGFKVLLPKGGITTFDNGSFSAAQINRFYYESIWRGRYGEILEGAGV